MPNAFSTVEPVFGLIKEVMGFRRFTLRGFEAVKGEWTRFVYCLQFEASLLPQCVNNWKSVSKIRSGAIVMALDWQNNSIIVLFSESPVLFNVKEFLSPTDS